MDNKPIIVTLCLIREKDRVLLALKKRGFGVGLWNGYGGKVLENEAIEQSAIRETQEEIGVEVKSLVKRGLMHFSWASNKNQPIECHVFEILEYTGEPIETEEMKPAWFDIDTIPYESMWDDDPIWLPVFLSGQNFKAKFVFSDEERILEHNLEETSFPLDF